MSESENVGTCSGIVDEPGRRGHVSLRFCGDLLCEIETRYIVESEDGAVWEERFKRLRRWLNRRYGPPTSSDIAVPDACSTADEFVACLRDGPVHARVLWSVAHARQVELFIPASLEDGTVIIGLRYGLPLATELLAPEHAR